MYLIRNIFKLFFVYCPVILLLIGLGAIAQKNISYVLEECAFFISQTASELLEVPCKAESVKLKGSCISVKGLNIKDRKGKDLIWAENIDLVINPFYFRTKSSPAKTIIISNAAINLYRENNIWNTQFLSDIFRKQKMNPTDFRGPVVLVRDCSLNINDPVSGYTDHLTDINIRMDLRSKNNPYISASVSSDYANNIKFSSHFDISEKKADIMADADKINLSSVIKYRHLIPENRYADIIEKSALYGTCSGHAEITVRNKKIKSIQAKASSKIKELSTPYGKITDGNIYIENRNNELFLNASLNANGAKTYIKALTDHKFSHIQGQITAKNINPDSFRQFIPSELKSLKGSADLTLNFAGNAENPRFSYIFKGKNISYENINTKSIISKGTFSDNALTYEIQSKIQSSSITSKGRITDFSLRKPDLKKITADAIVNIRNISLASLCSYKGKINADIKVSGRLKQPSLMANATLKEGTFSLKNKTFENIDAKISLATEAEKIKIESGLIKGIYNSEIFFRGYLDRKLDCEFNLSAGDVNLSELCSDLEKEIQGTGSVSSSITKKGDSITVKNLLNIQDLYIEDQKFNHIQTQFSVYPKYIKINSFTVLDFPATVTGKGIITPNASIAENYLKKITDDPDLISEDRKTENKIINFFTLKDITAKMPEMYFCINTEAKNLSSKHLMERFSVSDDNIKIIGDFTAAVLGKADKNSFSLIKGKGKLLVDNMSLYSKPFSNLSADINIRDNTVSFSNVHGDSVYYNVLETDSFGSLSGNGSYNIDTGSILCNIDLKNISLTEFRDYTSEYANINGLMQLNCKIYGTAKHENVNINCDTEISVPFMSLNGKSYRNTRFEGHLRDSDLLSGNFSLSKDSQSLTGNIEEFSVKNRMLKNGSLEIKNFSVNDIREIFYLSPIAKKPSVTKILNEIPVITEGEIQASLTCTGSLDSLEGKAEITATDINADFDRLKYIKASLTAKDGKVDLNEIDVKGTEFSLRGSAYPLFDRYNSDINLSMENLPLERFGKYINIENTKGNLSATANIKGDIRKPSVRASAKIDSPVIGNAEMVSLTVPEITVDEEYINISKEAYLSITDNNTVNLSGKIPADIFSENSSRKELLLNIKAPEQDLDFIETFLPHIAKGTTKGSFYAETSISGTPKDPKIDGIIQVREGEVHTIGNTCLQNISLDAKMVNTEDRSLLIDINDLSMSDNKGKENSLKCSNSYIKIANISGQSISQPRTYQGFRNRRTSNLDSILSASEINIEANLDSFFYKCRNFTAYRDEAQCTVNGNITVKGNLKEPLIYSENPIIISGLSLSAKSGTDQNTENQNAIIALANRQNDILLSYNDASNYEEIVIGRNREKSFGNAITPRLDLSVKADNCDIKIPATVLKTNCEAKISGIVQNPAVNGSVLIDSGKTSFQIARARFVKGSAINFSYENGIPKIDMNLEAFSNVHYTDKTGYDERYKINIYITGGLDSYAIKLESDPEGLTEKEILTAFTGIKQNSINAKESLARLGANTILSPIEDFFVSELGFSSLGFEFSENNYAIINIERSFGNKFYGSFYSNLYNRNQTVKNQLYKNIYNWELKFGYKLNKQFRINLKINDQKDKAVDFTYSIRF